MWPLTSFGHALKARSRWFIGQTRHLALVLCAFVAAHAVHKGAREVVYKAKVFWFGRGLRSVNWQEMGSLIIYSYLFPLLSLELPALLKLVWRCPSQKPPTLRVATQAFARCGIPCSERLCWIVAISSCTVWCCSWIFGDVWLGQVQRTKLETVLVFPHLPGEGC